MRKVALCSGINHPWKPPTILIMKDGSRRCYLECERCRSIRVDMRSPNGRVAKGRSYKHSDEFKEFLSETSARTRRASVWEDIFENSKERRYSEKSYSNLRLLQAPRARGQKR